MPLSGVSSIENALITMIRLRSKCVELDLTSTSPPDLLALLRDCGVAGCREGKLGRQPLAWLFIDRSLTLAPATRYRLLQTPNQTSFLLSLISYSRCFSNKDMSDMLIFIINIYFDINFSGNMTVPHSVTTSSTTNRYWIAIASRP